MSMFCYQCQETAMGTGCTLKGVCGKTSEVANLQDLLLFVVRGIAVYNGHLRKEGQSSEQADKFIYDALFITITNANFDKVAITEKIKEGLKLKKELAGKVKIENAPDECLWDGNEEEFEEKSKTVGVLRTPNEDIRSLKELVHYGLKGMAAYVEHAHNLGYQSPEIFAFMQHALSELTRNDITVEELVRAGALRRDQIRLHPKKNLITRAVGAASAEPDFFQFQAQEGYLLLCSDGLTNMIADDELKELLLDHSQLENKASQMIARANEYGGRDNISLVIVELKR